MKQLVVAAVAGCASLAHAQSFDWNRAWAGCSVEASAFDAEARSNAPGQSSRKVKAYVEEVTGTPPSVAQLRAKMEEDWGVLSNSKNWAYLIQLSSKLALCGTTAALDQLQSTASRPTQSAPSPVPSSPVAQRESEEDTLQCVRGITSESVLFNGCRKGVNLVWCAIPKSGKTPNVNCDSQEFSAADLSPGGRVSVEDNFLIAWTMCDAPKHPVSVRYVSGRGLEGKCRR